MKTKMFTWKRRILAAVLCVAVIAALAACGNGSGEKDEAAGPVEITIAAAASLENVLEQELIPLFEAANDGVTVQGVYDASGKLQTQIEEGLAPDLFFSAAMKQMNALVEEGYIAEEAVVPLLENKLVLIKAAGAASEVTGFEDIAAAETIALGDPASVPAGQYAEEALGNLGVLDAAMEKASLGTNVTEVLSWVEQGSAEVGIVYATDAAGSDKVEVIAEAPAGSLATPVIYPVAALKDSENAETAEAFLSFLRSEEALAVFRTYGFAVAE